MAKSTFKLLCDTKSSYHPPFKPGISPDEHTLSNITLSLEKSEVFINKGSLTPIIKDLTGEVKQSISHLARVRDIDWTQYHPTRAGVIPYYKTVNNIYFCLGEDSMSGQLGDFGGGVGWYETSLDGALRELSEESLGIFGPVADIQDNLIVTSKQMTIIFLPVPLAPTVYNTRFEANRELATSLEITNIYWLTQYQLQGLIDDLYPEGRVKLYYKVKDILSPVYSGLLKLL